MTPHTSFTTPHRIGLVVCMTALMLCAPMTTHQASAVDIGSALIEACYGQDADNTDALKEATAAECKVKEGSEDACQATSGTPWACHDPVGPTDKPDRRCKKTSAQVSLSGGISLPAGWSISGSISGKICHRQAKKVAGHTMLTIFSNKYNLSHSFNWSNTFTEI